MWFPKKLPTSVWKRYPLKASVLSRLSSVFLSPLCSYYRILLHSNPVHTISCHPSVLYTTLPYPTLLTSPTLPYSPHYFLLPYPTGPYYTLLITPPYPTLLYYSILAYLSHCSLLSPTLPYSTLRYLALPPSLFPTLYSILLSAISTLLCLTQFRTYFLVTFANQPICI